jgi:hypothetical protein
LTVPAFEAGEVVANELFIKTRRRSSGLILIGRPETAAVRSEEFIDQQKFVLRIEPEFKLGVGQNDSHLGGVRASGFVKREAAFTSAVERYDDWLIITIIIM